MNDRIAALQAALAAETPSVASLREALGVLTFEDLPLQLLSLPPGIAGLPSLVSVPPAPGSGHAGADVLLLPHDDGNVLTAVSIAAGSGRTGYTGVEARWHDRTPVGMRAEALRLAVTASRIPTEAHSRPINAAGTRAGRVAVEALHLIRVIELLGASPEVLSAHRAIVNDGTVALWAPHVAAVKALAVTGTLVPPGALTQRMAGFFSAKLPQPVPTQQRAPTADCRLLLSEAPPEVAAYWLHQARGDLQQNPLVRMIAVLYRVRMKQPSRLLLDFGNVPPSSLHVEFRLDGSFTEIDRVPGQALRSRNASPRS